MEEEEVELLKKTETKEELRRAEHEGVLNIQTLATGSPPHSSSSSSECAEGKAYNEKIQFAQMIIHDINTIRTFVVEFSAQK
jgi:hypothetical protein